MDQKQSAGGLGVLGLLGCVVLFLVSRRFLPSHHTMQTMGVSPREISSAGKRGTPQINRQGPKVHVKWRRMWNCTDNQDVGSEAATHLKSA